MSIIKTEIINEIKKQINEKYIFENVEMSEYSTLKLGGKADMIIDIHSLQDIKKAINISREYQIPLNIIGNGSNILVLSSGIRGICLKIAKGFSKIEVMDEKTLEAQAGSTLRAVSSKAELMGLEGLSFASGIPGTAGGGLVMNAGAYGSEMKDVVHSVETIDGLGKTHVFSNRELGFEYRKSLLQGTEHIVTSIRYRLTPGDCDEIATLSADFNSRRAEKQPLNLPSCGSTFKRPEGNYASALIDQCGLRGYRIGGCSVSEKHCGFLVNDKNGTVDDYIKLIEYVQKIVFDKTGIKLELEVKILGEV